MSDTWFRPFAPLEAMWLTSSKESNALLCCWAEISGPVTVPLLKRAVAFAREEHPYMQSAADLEAKGVGKSPLAEIPFTFQHGVSVASLRETIRAEMQHSGIDVTKCFVRVHAIFESAEDEAAEKVHLLLIGDHMAFDGRSFFSWLEGLLPALKTVSEDPEAKFEGAVHPFVEAGQRVPAGLTLAPFPPCESYLALANREGAEERPVSQVEDVSIEVDAEVFRALKALSKETDNKLNAPLTLAFSCAYADVVGKTGLCNLAVAVDIRNQVEPPVPSNYVGNFAGSVADRFEIQSEMDVWTRSKEVAAQLSATIAKGEAFRMIDFVSKGDWSVFMHMFSCSFIWSNIGHFPGSSVAGPFSLARTEFLLRGEDKSPLMSVHLVEVCDRLCVTLTYGPKFHEKATADKILARFKFHLGEMAKNAVYIYRITPVDQ